MAGVRALGLIVLLAACGSSDPPSVLEPAADAGVVDTLPVPLALELGRGFLHFEPLVNGATVEMVRGPQSLGRYYGYHFWLSVRAQGFDPEGISVTFVGTTSTATVVDTAFKFDLEPYADGYEASGFRGLISDCCATRGRLIDVSLSLVDRSGQVGHDHRQFQAEAECHVPGVLPPACPD